MSKWLKLFLLAVLCLPFANRASAQGSLYKDIAWRYTPAGAFPASGATITICTAGGSGTPCTPTVSVFADAGLSVPVSNPLSVCTVSPQFGCIDGLGNFSFYAAPAVYTYTVTGSGLTPYGPIPINVAVTNGGPASFTNLTVSGTGTFTGANVFTKIHENIQYADSTLSRGGVDIGDEINKAYAAGASTGVHVRVAPGVYNFTTPIVAGTGNKPIFLECAPGVVNNQVTNASTTQLNYTPTTGTALTINTSAGSTVSGCSLSGAGSGNSTIGLLVGGSNSNYYFNTNKTDIAGFGVGLQFGNGIVVTKFDTPIIHDNSTDILFPSGLSNTGENITFIGGSISNKGSAFSGTCINVLNSGMHLSFQNISIDQCGVTLNAANLTVDFSSVHIENPNGQQGTTRFINFGPLTNSTRLSILGGWINEDSSTSGSLQSFIDDASAVASHILNLTIVGTSFGFAEVVPALISNSGGQTGGTINIIGAQIGLGAFGVSSLLSGTWTNQTILNNNGNLTTSGFLQAGTNMFLVGRVQNAETAAPSGVASSDLLWGDSTAHRWKMNNNNAGADFVVGAATTDTLTNKTLNVPLTSGTGLQIFNTTTTCTTAASIGATCTTAAISLPVAEADTSYRLSCSGGGVPTAGIPVVLYTTKSSATQFTITVAALTAVAATASSFDCVAGHN